MTRLLLVAMLAACSDGGDRVDEFIGTWTYNAGSVSTVDCQNDALDSTNQLTNTFEVAAGVEHDLTLVPEPDSMCPQVELDVDGDVAKIAGGQSCMFTSDQGVTTMSTFNTVDATLDDAGTRLEISAAAAVQFSGTFNTTCAVLITGTANKTAQ